MIKWNKHENYRKQINDSKYFTIIEFRAEFHLKEFTKRVDGCRKDIAFT